MDNQPETITPHSTGPYPTYGQTATDPPTYFDPQSTAKKRSDPLAERKVLNAGLVALMSVDGDDITPAEAARTSYRDFVDSHTNDQNENLVDYLIRHKHSTPLEFASATFRMEMPIFVARQLVRHRTASINETSLRYVAAAGAFYIPSPEECKRQSETNKQGGGASIVDNPEDVRGCIQSAGEEMHAVYADLRRTGLSNEICRTVLPLGQYTTWQWRANLRNIMGLLELRLDSHAQEQTRVYAQAMMGMLEPYFPNTFAAWRNHVLEAVTFSGDEWAAMKEELCLPTRNGAVLEVAEAAGMRKTRLKEFEAKLQR